MNKKRGITILILIGLLLTSIFIKCYYIEYTETWQRQHDVISFGADEGHAAYIEYILNNKKLPDFDPRTKWGFFQPPLHHIVSAVTMELSMKAGTSYERAQENTQIPTCAYMIFLTLLAGYAFIKSRGVLKLSHSNTSGKMLTAGMVTVLAITGFHPMFIFLSGSINNDSLALILSFVALIIGCSWYKNPTMLRTVLLAIVIGLAMLAKLTGGLVAVPIGILMIARFLGFGGSENIHGQKVSGIKLRIEYFFARNLAKAFIFALIVFPLGLSFTIYNKLRWGMPFNYIPPVGENFPENITFGNRLFDVATDSVYTKMVSRGDAFDEYCMPLALVKTSLYSEYSFSNVSRWMKPVTLVLFISALILILIGLFATVYVTFSKKSHVPVEWKIALFFTYLTYLAAYMYFALSYSNFSAQDFRYAAICIVCEAIYTGIFVDTMRNNKIRYTVSVVAFVFAVSSFAMFALLGFKS